MSLVSELRGGVGAAAIVVPLAISYGLLAYAPLGPAAVSAAMLPAFLAAIITPLAVALLGLSAPIIFVTRSIGAVVLASFLGEMIATLGLETVHPSHSGAGGQPLLVAGAVLLFVLTVATFEFLFGAARFGRLAKYLPAPVVAGFRCGIAMVLLLSQTGGLLGIDQHVTLGMLTSVAGAIRPLAVLVAALTILTVIAVGRLKPRWPAFAVALVAGSVAHALLQRVLGPDASQYLGGTLGPLALHLPDFNGVRAVADTAVFNTLVSLLPMILGWGLTAAVMTSVDTLIGLKVVEEAADRPIYGDREMMRMGLANCATALVGGMHGGTNIPSTIVNIRNGGTSRVSTVCCALAVAFTALLLAPLLAHLSRAAIAGVLTVLAFQMFDAWTLQVARQAIRQGHPNPDVAGMLGTVLAVTGVAVFTNLLAAVFTGLVIAVVSFIWRMSRSIVRRRYTVCDVQSRHVRAAAARDLLQAHGQRIVVFELEGPLFFGTAEKLTDAIGTLLTGDVLVIVLDLQRVNDVDSTGVRLLAQVQRRLARFGKVMVFSGVSAHGRVARLLDDFGMASPGQGIRLFHDSDSALEWAEDRLLEALGKEASSGADVPLETLDMLLDFTAAEIDEVRPFLMPRRYTGGDVVFRRGEDGNEMFAIAAGRASVTLEHASQSDLEETRLVTFSAGAFFGEFAVLDRQPRSATVRADTDLFCHVLTVEAFEALKREHPACAIKLLANLGRELSKRLRSANQTIRVLSL